MKLDETSGYFKVNFSDQLIILIKDVRQLKEFGYKVQKKVNDLSEQAKKMYKEGLALKQVANFYNSMSTQIIPSQKKMLLNSALQFENAVNPKRPNFPKWNDPAEVEEYISAIQKAADVLMVDTRQLRKLHSSLIEEVVDLMNTDLLRNRKRWDEKLIVMNKVISSSGRSTVNSQQWRRHWDRQLYKALELQYKLGLESLN